MNQINYYDFDVVESCELKSWNFAQIISAVNL